MKSWSIRIILKISCITAEVFSPVRQIFAFFVLAGTAIAATPPNWKAALPPCGKHSELLKHGPMNIGVRFQTVNTLLAARFKSALDFWSKVVEMTWHEDNTEGCAMELADGVSDLFASAPNALAARSQFPDRSGFYGWIAFNPIPRLDNAELYRISVHEIGHVLGLRHSTHAASLMYAYDLDDSGVLDAADLAALATHHRLRLKSLKEPVSMLP
jgi:hypothetical protein